MSPDTRTGAEVKRLILTAQEARDAAAGTLTEVRRPIVNPPRLWDSWDHLDGVTCSRRRSYIWVGDLLWGAESFRAWGDDDCEHDDAADCGAHCHQEYVAYEATPKRGYRPVPDKAAITYLHENAPVDGDPRLCGPWQSADTMPQWASRVTLRLTAVRAEKVDGVWTWIGTVEPAGGVK